MKNLNDRFPTQPSKLSNCISFQIVKEEADTLFGGFREYKPPIYDLEEKENIKIETTNLMTDITHSSKKS